MYETSFCFPYILQCNQNQNNIKAKEQDKKSAKRFDGVTMQTSHLRPYKDMQGLYFPHSHPESHRISV